MRIAVLHASYEDSDAPFASIDPECDPSRYAPEHQWTNVRLRKSTAVRDLMMAARAEFDVYVNLCDGSWDEDRAGIEVVHALERMGAAFTGAGSRFYDPSRTAMKMAAHSMGVSVPAFVHAMTGRDVKRALDTLHFPMLVKHPNSYASVGMTKASRVIDPASLKHQVARMIELFGGALIEEFIEGRELTVLVAEPKAPDDAPLVFAPVEFLFPDGETFKHFDLKWKDFDAMKTHVLTDVALDAKARRAAGMVFDAMGGSGFARCDFRVNDAGEVYFLEINPNCGVFYPEGQFGSADFILARDPLGHRGFLEHLLTTARTRQRREAAPWEVHFSSRRGFEMVASQAIAEGQVAVRYEERNQRLVSREHVEASWRGRRREWIERYAWPMSDRVFALWSDEPEEWFPINHSCDPNTWLTGLDLVARRPILEGEPVTVDYATFCGRDMADFECHCGSSECRRVIRGIDYLRPDLRARFEGHLSDYVRTASAAWTRPLEFVANAFGLGVITRQPWKRDEVIAQVFWSEPQDHPGRWTVQRGAAVHGEPRPLELRYVNHSCAPNVIFDVERNVLRALRDVSADEELRFFYPATEWEMAEVFDCRCGAPACIGRIRGAADLSNDLLATYELSDYVRARVAARGG